MPRFYASAAVWVTLTLLATCLSPDRVFAASPTGATDTPDKTVPQGNDPAGADNGDQPTPPLVPHKGAIEPPPIGDEDIYTGPRTLMPDMRRKLSLHPGRPVETLT
jgi:hypothetical protein